MHLPFRFSATQRRELHYTSGLKLSAGQTPAQPLLLSYTLSLRLSLGCVHPWEGSLSPGMLLPPLPTHPPEFPWQLCLSLAPALRMSPPTTSCYESPLDLYHIC